MRNAKSLVILSSLALAVAEGEMVRLAPEDVPVECATMCGPVVELTGICHIGSHEMLRRLKRRKVEQQKRHNHREMYKRQFITNAFGQLVPAPRPNGDARTVTQVITRTAGAAVASAASVPPASRIPGNAVFGGAVQTNSPGGIAAAEDDGDGPLADPSQTPVAVGNALGDDSSVDGDLQISDGDAADIMDDMYTHKKESEAIEAAEEECICLNTSFDVPLVSALCSSCIKQAGDMSSSMNIIMWQCNFTEEEYDPSRETAVFNVRVEASRPTVLADSNNALISDSPPSPGVQNGFMGVVVAGVACGIAMLL